MKIVFTKRHYLPGQISAQAGMDCFQDTCLARVVFANEHGALLQMNCEFVDSSEVLDIDFGQQHGV